MKNVSIQTVSSSSEVKTLSTNKLIDENPDVKAFIYQQIYELTPFLTPETVVTVVARDPLKLISHFDLENVDEQKEILRNSHRIAFVLKDKEAKLEAEGIHEDIFEAIQIAKRYLVTHLAEVQNSVISNQDRMVEINQALGDNSTH